MNKFIIPIIVAVLIIAGIATYVVFKLEEPTTLMTPPPTTQSSVTTEPGREVHIGMVRSVRTTPSGIEIEVMSDKEFPARNELVVLRIGAQKFMLSRYPESGDMHALIFTLTPKEFAKITTGELVSVQYGSGGEPYEQWSFGALDKGILDAANHKSSTSTGVTLSKLKVSGNRIVTENGQEIRLRGVNFADPFLLENDHPDADGVPDHHFSKKIAEDFARVKKLGANVVRLAIYPGYYRLVGGESYLTTYVDREVDLAEENELYIILSYQVIGRPGGWYDSPSDATLWQYPAKVHYTDSDMAVAFWDKVATRYGQRKHVLFEMYNEPADETADYTWADWRPTGELLIKTIRQHSDNIILGPGPNYSSDLSDVPKNPYSDSNLVYVAHVYPVNVPKREDQVSSWERTFGFLAKTYPVIVSEWGFSNGGDETTNGTLEGYGRPLLDYLDQKNIHWTAFVYHPMDPGQGQLLIESDWTTLTEFGKFVKERLQSVPH